MRLGVRVTGVDLAETGYRVTTAQGDFLAENVVIAVGIYQQPRIPPFAADIPAEVLQLHSGEYRHPSVLVAGSAQSGCQIAEELLFSGRKVYLSLGGGSGRALRHYRGREILRWLDEVGFLTQTYDLVPEPKNKLSGNPLVISKDGGHSLNVHQYAHDGMILLGHITGVQNGSATFAPDYKASLAIMDRVEKQIMQIVDGYIAKNGIQAPLETLPQLTDGYAAEVITRLDFKAHGITSLIWAIGYVYDFG